MKYSLKTRIVSKISNALNENKNFDSQTSIEIDPSTKTNYFTGLSGPKLQTTSVLIVDEALLMEKGVCDDLALKCFRNKFRQGSTPTSVVIVPNDVKRSEMKKTFGCKDYDCHLYGALSSKHYQPKRNNVNDVAQYVGNLDMIGSENVSKSLIEEGIFSPLSSQILITQLPLLCNSSSKYEDKKRATYSNSYPNIFKINSSDNQTIPLKIVSKNEVSKESFQSKMERKHFASLRLERKTLKNFELFQQLIPPYLRRSLKFQDYSISDKIFCLNKALKREYEISPPKGRSNEITPIDRIRFMIIFNGE